MSAAIDRGLDLRHYARLIWRRRGIVLVVVVAIFCAAVITMALVPHRYESSAVVLIEERRPLTPELEKTMGGWGPGMTRQEEKDLARLSQIAERVRTRAFLERVIRILRMDQDPTIRAQAAKEAGKHPELTLDEATMRLLVEALQKRIDVDLMGAGIYRINVMEREPRTAHLLAKWISELFVDITVQRELERIQTAKRFGLEQLRVYETKLEESEEAFEAYQSGLIRENLAAPSFPPEALRLAESIQRQLAEDAATAQARSGPLSRAAGSAGYTHAVHETVSEDPQVGLARQQLVDCASAAILGRLATAGPMSQTVDIHALLLPHRTKLLHSVEAWVAGRFPHLTEEERLTMVNAAFVSLDEETSRSLAHKLGMAIQGLKRRHQTGPANEIELVRLRQEVDKNREILSSFRAQLVASDVSQAVETTNLGLQVEILDPAQVPLQASWPQPAKILIMAALLGILLSVSAALLVEFMDPRLRTLDEILRVAPEPVLAMIPYARRSSRPRQTWRRHWAAAGVTGVILLTAAFFVARATVLSDQLSRAPVRAVDPEKGLGG
jgi:uncharacterized protein involved in exopolysaccharide biosynthesis